MRLKYDGHPVACVLADEAAKGAESAAATKPEAGDTGTNATAASSADVTQAQDSDVAADKLQTRRSGAAVLQRDLSTRKDVLLIEREQAAGRLGGGKGKSIVYDEAAVDRLLDR